MRFRMEIQMRIGMGIGMHWIQDWYLHKEGDENRYYSKDQDKDLDEYCDFDGKQKWYVDWGQDEDCDWT